MAVFANLQITNGSDYNQW